MAERWRGICTILLTPFLEDRSLDEASLRREVDFVVAAGAHGIVTPVNTSELFLLADEERDEHDLAELDAALELARPDLVAEVVA
jgi:dihydrodipicolinate synthase/N-acetylneuraminate lyase